MLVGDRIAVVYLVDVQSRVRTFGLDGTAKAEVPLPEPGSVVALSARNDGGEIYLRFSSYLRPATIFRYDLRSAAIEPFHAPESKVRLLAVRDESAVLPVQGRHEGPHLRDPAQRRRPRRQPSDRSVRIRRIQHFDPSVVLTGGGRLARPGWRLCRREHPRRRRVRQRVARGWQARTQAERVRRFHRRSQLPRPREIHDVVAPRDRWAARTAACWSRPR